MGVRSLFCELVCLLSAGVGLAQADPPRGSAELTSVCSETIQELVTPFGSQQVSVARGGNSHFFLTTPDDAIVLQMPRPGELPASATTLVAGSPDRGQD
jgi:hypothetical protein